MNLSTAFLLLSSYTITSSWSFQLSPTSPTIIRPSTKLHADTATTASSSTSTATTPDMTAFSNGYKTVFNEISCALAEPTVGSLPLDLAGTYYKCGPAMFSA